MALKLSFNTLRVHVNDHVLFVDYFLISQPASDNYTFFVHKYKKPSLKIKLGRLNSILPRVVGILKNSKDAKEILTEGKVRGF